MSFLEIYELQKQISNIYQEFVFLKIKSQISNYRYNTLIKNNIEDSRETAIVSIMNEFNIPEESAKIILYEAILDIYDISKRQIQLKVDTTILLQKLKELSEEAYKEMYYLLEEHIK